MRLDHLLSRELYFSSSAWGCPSAAEHASFSQVDPTRSPSGGQRGCAPLKSPLRDHTTLFESRPYSLSASPHHRSRSALLSSCSGGLRGFPFRHPVVGCARHVDSAQPRTPETWLAPSPLGTPRVNSGDLRTRPWRAPERPLLADQVTDRGRSPRHHLESRPQVWRPARRHVAQGAQHLGLPKTHLPLRPMLAES